MQKRSRYARWVYYGTVLLAGILTLRAFRFVIQSHEYNFGELADSGVMVWTEKIALTAALEQPLLLLLVLASLLARSGAAIWLTAWFAISSTVPIVGPILWADPVEGTAPILVTLGLIIFAVALLLTYLVRTGELRRP